MRCSVKNLFRNTDGAVAPTVALSLVMLIAAGGVAFDYARLATLDTELQQAADQAALAAATQLDGNATATTRAIAAAQGLLENRTYFANDGGNQVIQTGTSDVDGGGTTTRVRITFYSNKADAEADTNGFGSGATNADANAKFVKVEVVGRKAKYAFTPIVGAFDSGVIEAAATAGLGSAICKVPPVMICNPDEPDPNTNASFPFNANAYAGRGLKLVAVGNGNSAWAPGNFGYLDTGSSTSNPNVELREALGWQTAPGDCSALTGVETRTGADTPVPQAINTRFDIYEKANTGNGMAASCPTGGSCPPSINSTKDLIRKSAPQNGNKCGIANTEWELPLNQYLPTSDAGTIDLTANPVDAMGHPRDKCHAVSTTGTCGKVGNGDWDRDAYFMVNYGWDSTEWKANVQTGTAPLPNPTTTPPSRYRVYLWEAANRGTTIDGAIVLGTRNYGSGPNAAMSYGQPVCSAMQTPSTSGIVPGGTNVDRRKISAAVINCNHYDVHGGGNTVYPVLKWIELFLVEPSLNRARTDANDVYVEIIGETTLGGGAGQVVRRDVPYLVR